MELNLENSEGRSEIDFVCKNSKYGESFNCLNIIFAVQYIKFDARDTQMHAKVLDLRDDETYCLKWSNNTDDYINERLACAKADRKYA